MGSDRPERGIICMLATNSRIQLPKKFNSLLGTTARFKGYYSGRAGAKSHTLAQGIIINMATRPNLRVLCCREIQRSIKESVKRLLDDKIIALGLGHMFHSTAKEISSRNGSWCGFEGLRNNMESIRSYEGIGLVWTEEASTVSQNSFDTLTPTIRVKGSELWFSWNPRSPKDPVDAFFRGPGAQLRPPPELMTDYDEWIISQQLQVEDNKFFPDTMRAEMEWDKRRDPDRYRHVWLGDYLQMSSSRVFKNWKIGTLDQADALYPERMAAPGVEKLFEWKETEDGRMLLEPQGTPNYGADFGFSIDPTVLVRVYVYPKRRILYIDAEVTKVGLPIEDTPNFFDQIEGPSPRRWPITADSSRPETIQYIASHGYDGIKGARKGAGSLEEGVEFLQGYDIIVHPNCARSIDELTLYSYEVDKLTNAVLPKFADKHNHVIDAIRYAVEDLRRAAIFAVPLVLTQPRTFFGDYIAGDGYG